MSFPNELRKVFANTPEAKKRRYKTRRFSFSVKQGRCQVCEGHGRRRVEMHFLPDVWVTCSECEGQRFNRQTLEITYKDKSIADVLDMDVQEALEFFADHPKTVRILQTLRDVGLGYVKLGQSALTLSGGEAQRVKLAKELSRVDTGRTIYLLDEPTTGLHFADIQKLLDVLYRLTEAGNTVIIIEHNLDVIKTADWVIDLGPEGGDEGGHIVGTMGISRDITEQKRAQEALQKLNKELDQRVAVRTAELQESLKTLRETRTQLIQSERTAALGRLVSGIAHEINTPIGIGVTAASYLDVETRQIKELYDGNIMTHSDFKRYIQTATESSSMILKNLRRAADLIQTFKQVSVDQITEHQRVFHLKEYIEGVLLSLQPALKKTKHTLRLHCPEELEIKSYPGAFSQIITNLVMNSLIHGFEKHIIDNLV